MNSNQDLKADKLINYLIEVVRHKIESCKDEKNKWIYEKQHEQLSKLNVKINKDTVLYKLINSIEPACIDFNEHNLIFPFTYNLSQKDAIYNALCNDISLIQGPPGTGKTQAIINIIANLIYQNKKVAVVSANNDAILNINEKLSEVDLDFLAAYLSNKDSKDNFFENKYRNPIPENCLRWKEYNISGCRENLHVELYNTDLFLEKQRQNSVLKQDIVEWKAELESFKKQIITIQDNIHPKLINSKISFNKIKKMRKNIELRKSIDKHSWISNYFLKKKLFKPISKFDINQITDYIDEKYYEYRIKELEDMIEANENYIKNYDLKNSLDISTKLSKDLLYQKIGNDYAGRGDSKNFTTQNYKSRFKDFLHHYPVFLSTTSSLVNASGEFVFDYVIMDESSQIDLITGVLAMSCAKNVVLVGDLMQLQHIVTDEKSFKKIFNKWEDILPKYFEFSNYSILRCINDLYKEKAKTTLLREHYRCDPYIINFCNKEFYDNKLIIMTKHQAGNGIFFTPTVQKEHEHINTEEANVVIKCLQNITGKMKTDIGVITPYNKQRELIVRLMENDSEIKKIDAATVIVSTVHKFQGREKNCIIISTVNKEISKDKYHTDFLDNNYLLNVAVSRAKNYVYVVSNNSLLHQNNTIYNDLYKYAKYYKCGSEINDSKYVPIKIFSAFQLLHESDHPDWQDFSKRMLRISENNSENIVATKLNEILKSKYKRLYYLFNYPLRRTVNAQDFDEEKQKFINNINTHCDFVIIDKIDKKIKAAIEVDGKTHTFDEKQINRDRKKNKILEIAGIPLLRTTTFSSVLEYEIEELLKKI